MAEMNRIVVGVDGSECSRTALKWARQEALDHGAELFAVSAWMNPPVPFPLGGLPARVESAPEETAKRVLDDTLRETLGDQPDVVVHSHVREGNAAKVLIDLSKEADLLVVGNRGRGGFSGLLLGSVSQHVAAHADCTVVVVRE
jgi:nucleotide-binding universal stress UspA family protein